MNKAKIIFLAMVAVFCFGSIPTELFGDKILGDFCLVDECYAYRFKTQAEEDYYYKKLREDRLVAQAYNYKRSEEAKVKLIYHSIIFFITFIIILRSSAYKSIVQMMRTEFPNKQSTLRTILFLSMAFILLFIVPTTFMLIYIVLIIIYKIIISRDEKGK